jgi:hypothetical protein
MQDRQQKSKPGTTAQKGEGMIEIKPRIVDGEPVCDPGCPALGANDHCLSRSPGCYMVQVNPMYGGPCVPGLREQRDRLMSEIKPLRAYHKRWVNDHV